MVPKATCSSTRCSPCSLLQVVLNNNTLFCSSASCFFLASCYCNIGSTVAGCAAGRRKNWESASHTSDANRFKYRCLCIPYYGRTLKASSSQWHGWLVVFGGEGINSLLTRTSSMLLKWHGEGCRFQCFWPTSNELHMLWNSWQAILHKCKGESA